VPLIALLRRDDLSTATRELIDQAPRYGEGTGFRMPVSSIADCAAVEVVVDAKMGYSPLPQLCAALDTDE
jgi:hypothetical protein